MFSSTRSASWTHHKHKSKPQKQPFEANESGSNIITNNSHLLLKERSFNSGLQNQSKSVSVGGSNQRLISSSNKRGGKLLKIHSSNHTEVYYTVESDNSPLNGSSSGNQVVYFDRQGNEINPVDLMFDDSSNSRSSVKMLNKLGRNSKNQQSLPCIGAQEFVYGSSGQRDINKDLQLNVMPSFTSVDTLFDDSPMLSPQFDRYEVSNSTSQAQSRVTSNAGIRMLSSLSMDDEKELPKEPTGELSYFSLSLWDCVTYVASFLPPIPMPNLTIPFDEAETNELEPKQTDKVEPLAKEKDIKISVQSTIPLTHQLPPVPPKEKKRIPPLSPKKIRSKFHDFAYPTDVDIGLSVAKLDQKNREDSFNRVSHPSFLKRYGAPEKGRSVTTGKLRF